VYDDTQKENEKRQINMQRHRADLTLKYQRVFKSDEGKEVLADLCRANNVLKPIFDADPVKMAFNEGNRNAILMILSYLNTNTDEVKDLLNTLEYKRKRMMEV